MKRIVLVLVLLIVPVCSAFAQPAPPASPGCVCSPGHWLAQDGKSCITGAGACKVAGMPDGDKGGGYFAWQGSLFVHTPCAPCANLDLTTSTGQPGWTLVSGPGVTTPKVPVPLSPLAGWGTIPGASWVSAAASGDGSGGNYTYEYKFCLCQSAKGMRLSLTLLADNGATVWLNAKQLYATTGDGNFKNPPLTVPPFTGTPADWIIPGMNTVRIVVNNGSSSPTGLSAKLNIVAQNGACPAVPSTQPAN